MSWFVKIFFLCAAHGLVFANPPVEENRDGFYRWRRTFDAAGERVHDICMAYLLDMGGVRRSNRIIVAGSRPGPINYLASFNPTNGEASSEHLLGPYEPLRIMAVENLIVLLSGDLDRGVYQLAVFQVTPRSINLIWRRTSKPKPSGYMELVPADATRIALLDNSKTPPEVLFLNLLDGRELPELRLPANSVRILPARNGSNQFIFLHTTPDSAETTAPAQRRTHLSLVDENGTSRNISQNLGPHIWNLYRAVGPMNEGFTLVSTYLGAGVSRHQVDAINDNGQIRWSRPGRLLFANDNDALVFDYGEHTLYRINTQTGAIHWLTTPPMRDALHFEIKARVEGQTIYAGLTGFTHRGAYRGATGLYAISLESGAQEWFAFNNPRIQQILHGEPISALDGGILFRAGRAGMALDTAIGVVLPPVSKRDRPKLN